MRNLKFLAMAVVASFALSCGGGESDEPGTGGGGGGTPTTFTVAMTQTTFSPQATTKPITITCNAAWTASANVDWITISPSSGKGTTAATAATVSLGMNKTAEARTGVITVTSGSSKQTVTITQKAVTEMFPETEVFLIKQETVDFKIVVNGAWSAAIPSDAEAWLSVTPKNGTGDASIQLKGKDDNENVGDRKTNLTFTISGETINIPVTQKQKNVIVFTEGSTNRDYQAGTFDIATNTNVNFSVEVTQGADWLHFVETKALNSKKSTFRIDQNPANTARTAQIKFSYEDLTETHDVIQGPFNTVILKTEPGVYDFAGKDYTYTKGADQLSVFKSSETVGFRMMSPKDLRVVEISGLPADAKLGTVATVALKILEGRETVAKNSGPAYVVKEDENYFWLSLSDGSGAIIKK